MGPGTILFPGVQPAPWPTPTPRLQVEGHKVEVVDTTGGDTFHAAIVKGTLSGWGWRMPWPMPTPPAPCP